MSLSSNTLRQLIEREWIDIIGQKEVPGRPSLYATTKHFLNDFALKSLSELPELNSSLAAELSNTDENDIAQSSNNTVDSNMIVDEKDFSNNIIPPAK